ncbi:hypothetical protein EFM36_06710 [Limosilactobacillus fermentum]|nr:hypothetical protein [Limosilactobacillus fermentum]
MVLPVVEPVVLPVVEPVVLPVDTEDVILSALTAYVLSPNPTPKATTVIAAKTHFYTFYNVISFLPL